MLSDAEYRAATRRYKAWGESLSNRRRGDLIHKKHSGGGLSPEEERELELHQAVGPATYAPIAEHNSEWQREQDKPLEELLRRLREGKGDRP